MNAIDSDNPERNSTGSHWEEYWRSATHDEQALGGPNQQQILGHYWRSVLENEAANEGLILDIAAGNGAVFDNLLAVQRDQVVKGRLIALDFSYSAVRALSKDKGVDSFVASAAALPIASGSIQMAVSQFGIEYAGGGAFREAARIISSGGKFSAIIHYKGGAIEAECAEQAQLLRAFQETNAFEAAAPAIIHSIQHSEGGRRHLAEPSLEAAARDAAVMANKLLTTARDTTARKMLVHYFNSLCQLSERRIAFAEEDAVGWLNAASDAVAHYLGRMKAMVSVAVSDVEIALVKETFERENMVVTKARPLSFSDSAAPGAWVLEAEKH